MTDPTGNSFVGPPVTATIPAGTPPAPSAYAASVLADSPNYFWRMDEASGTTAYDRAGSDDMVLNTATAAGRNISGALLNESDAATNFPGTSSTGTNPGVSPFWQSGTADVLARDVAADVDDERRQDHRLRRHRERSQRHRTTTTATCT